jgi:hypothetical protein
MDQVRNYTYHVKVRIRRVLKVNKISGENIHNKESYVTNASDKDFGEMQIADFNYSITLLGCSPVKLHSVAQRKFWIMGVNTYEGCGDLSTLMDKVKHKYATCSKQEVSKLKLMPKSWPVQGT